MEHFGNTIRDLRTKLKISQAELAAAAGVSQATISRLETTDQIPADMRLLSKVAKGLKEPLNDLLPEDFLKEMTGASEVEVFSAFCPNPFCEENRSERNKGGKAVVVLHSWTTYDVEQFNEINYCGACGTELVKECPNCKRRFGDKLMKYCVTCQRKIWEPTPEEMERLEETVPRRGIGEEEIPF